MYFSSFTFLSFKRTYDHKTPSIIIEKQSKVDCCEQAFFCFQKIHDARGLKLTESNLYDIVRVSLTITLDVDTKLYQYPKHRFLEALKKQLNDPHIYTINPTLPHICHVNHFPWKLD